MDLFQLGWTGDNGDPDNFLAVLFDGMESAAVRTQWQNEAFHKLMDEEGRPLTRASAPRFTRRRSSSCTTNARFFRSPIRS